MPFEPAPKTEQEDRVALGRIALEAIAAHILTVPPENFNMTYWCGTACCAIGNSIHLPEVRATGLYLHPSSDAIQRAFPAFAGEVEDFMSIGKAFGISRDDASELFAGGIDTGFVSQRIRKYLAA